MATLKKVRTKVLEIAYEESGPETGVPVLLMHGFPYDPRAYDVRATVARTRAASPEIRTGLVADQRALTREALRRRRPRMAAKALAASLALAR